MELDTQNIAFPLEIFYEIYKYCAPPTVYSLACTSSELNKLASKYFELFAANIHREKFAPSLELINTGYITISDYYPDDDHDEEDNYIRRYEYLYNMSIRIDKINNRQIGYSHTLEEYDDVPTIFNQLVVVSSGELKFTAEWIPITKDNRAPRYKFHNNRVYATKHETCKPVDPTDEDYIYGVVNYTWGDHIVIKD
ncbi:Hypothetical protein PACV_127 [Pacmanvirus A23]|uniref:Hypothetical protein n=1 Tax=Pacmanvirus A23 TaxID=1932881 RepID=UPI000A095FCF|nr:Hypothetical protein B9W72_gp126 [Pacmanvirus A23]SIP85843.1 Hypothetical protein PACV_127 [Pacmanvirus A23]